MGDPARDVALVPTVLAFIDFEPEFLAIDHDGLDLERLLPVNRFFRRFL